MMNDDDIYIYINILFKIYFSIRIDSIPIIGISFQVHDDFLFV